jgi:hypothetical protein
LIYVRGSRQKGSRVAEEFDEKERKEIGEDHKERCSFGAEAEAKSSNKKKKVAHRESFDLSISKAVSLSLSLSYQALPFSLGGPRQIG